MIDKPEEILQTFLKQYFHKEIPVCYENYGLPDSHPEACICCIEDWTAGDIYSGYITYYTLVLRDFYRPDTGALLEIRIDYAFHSLSGQYDAWKVIISGALETEKEMLLQAAKPTRNLSSSAITEITFNGTTLS